ncbi:hypothetical protein FA13DRAFT_1787149 [Coprinellus micaceus]|uniref:Flavodoxin-like domain-containing protein n=1 Tax=Coprinellus micaceus TaxID=71717 RepID=A0A4Y7TRJ0_COPMI|nr:hypothetical protein FA13DRAFT_1787149 [Coprinellus micaceus]
MSFPRVAIIIYSMYGHVAQLAEAEKAGIEGAGGKAEIYQFDPSEVLVKMDASPKHDCPVPVDVNDTLVQYDAFLFGIPTRYGNFPAQHSGTELAAFGRLPSLTNALELLVFNSRRAAMGIGASFALKRLILKSILLGAEDRYGTVMVVREMVEELTLDCSPCAWHEPSEFFARLDKWAASSTNNANKGTGEAEKEGEQAGPMVLFPNINIFTAVTNRKSRLSFTVAREDQVTYATFRVSPLAWWRDCQLALDEAEAQYPDSDDPEEYYNEWDEDFDGDQDDGGG